MTTASFVQDAAIAAIVELANRLQGDTASRIAADAGQLAYAPDKLAAAFIDAVSEQPDHDGLAELASRDTLPPVAKTTANRRLQASNQDALADLLRLLALAAYAERMISATFHTRIEAKTALQTFAGLFDDLATKMDPVTYRNMRSLQAALADHVRELNIGLPQVATEAYNAVLPSIVLSYDYYDDIARSDEVALRNEAPRPGFVPAGAVEFLR